MQRATILTAALSLLLLTVPATAQSGRGGSQRQSLDPERAWAAWELEAEGVAHRLGLSEEASKQLTKAYMNARSGYAKELESMGNGRRGERDGGDRAGREEGRREGRERGAGDDDRGDRGEGSRRRGGANREAMRELRESQQAKLKTEITAIVPAESLESTVAVLGSFNPQWDTLVDTLAGFELDDEKKYAALDAVESYVGVFATMRRGGGGEGGFDREAMMEKFRSSTENLNDALGKILTEEQMEKMSKHLRMRGRGRRAPRELDT